MGVQELLIIFAILLLFFGAKKLPGLAGSLGTSIKEFRKAADSAEDADGPGDGRGSESTHGSTSADVDPADHDTER